MQKLNSYIFEKLHLNKNIKVYDIETNFDEDNLDFTKEEIDNIIEQTMLLPKQPLQISNLFYFDKKIIPHTTDIFLYYSDPTNWPPEYYIKIVRNKDKKNIVYTYHINKKEGSYQYCKPYKSISDVFDEILQESKKLNFFDSCPK